MYAQGDVRSLEIPDAIATIVNALLDREGREGIFIADRTAGTATQGRRWVPAASNLRQLPQLADVGAGGVDAWAAFPGNWGIDDLVSPRFALTCLFDVKNVMMGHQRQGSRRAPTARNICTCSDSLRLYMYEAPTSTAP